MTDPALLILASLADGDKHGYAMMIDITAFSGVTLGPGTLYGAITRLEEKGWIRPVPSEDRRQPASSRRTTRLHRPVRNHRPRQAGLGMSGPPRLLLEWATRIYPRAWR